MTKFLLNLLLYNYSLKRIANFLLKNRLFIQNPLYLHFYRQRINQVINQYSQKPFAIRIENTNICNGRCFMCPHPLMKRKQGLMDKDLYKKIIDNMSSLGISYLNLHNFGEPLLDKHFIWRIKYAKQKGITKITTNTNGELLNKKMAREIINSGLDEIFISLDAAKESTYQKIRIGLNYSKVMSNLKYLIRLKEKSKQKKPQIIVDFLISDLNCGEVDLFKQKWQDKVDNICLSEIHDWSLKVTGLSNRQYKNYVSYSKAPCRLPFTEMLVNFDGRVGLCCQDIEAEVIYGDLKTQSISEIWQSHLIEKIRNKHQKISVDKLKICQNCKLRTFWWFF
jgi:radical SAM protein with 4Fe4S-binding SPASM domain